MALYRLLISLFAALVVLREGRARLSVPKPQDGVHVWLHGASNGELTSVRPLLEALAAARPDLRWLVTTNSPMGREMVARWALPRVSARLSPLDLVWVTRRVIRDWQVAAHISLEAEIWPHRVVSCPGPVLLLGARMSAGTARSWARVPGFARRIHGRLAFVSAQDADSDRRLLDLGVTPAARGPVVDLKGFYSAPSSAPDPALAAAFPRADTWLAASTHEGDEAPVLEAHRRARAQERDLRLILAPRHPHRAPDLRHLAESAGFTVAQRSRAEAPQGADVYLADTLGEMPLWYALAGRVFVGGTWSDRRGHTPYEPAAHGAALIHGPDMRNFATAAGRLAEAGAAEVVKDAAELAAALARLSDPQSQARAGAAARTALAPQTGPDALRDQVLAVLART